MYGLGIINDFGHRMHDTSAIYRCDFHHPQLNLSANGKVKESSEDDFASYFAQAYQSQFSQIHSRTTRKETLFVREVPVSGNGIADLLVLSWATSLTCSSTLSSSPLDVAPTIRAFEFKLSNWRNGMMQAHRYKYFSHASILVVPKSKLKVVKPRLALFRTLRVGLWGFEPESARIHCLFTPRPKQQVIPECVDKALRQISQTVQS